MNGERIPIPDCGNHLYFVSDDDALFAGLFLFFCSINSNKCGIYTKQIVAAIQSNAVEKANRPKPRFNIFIESNMRLTIIDSRMRQAVCVS